MTVKLPKIRGFHNIYKELQYSGLPGLMTWTARIKLHGTNAGIRFEPGADKDPSKIIAQKRSEDITVENDNFGFARFVDDNREMFRDWYSNYMVECEGVDRDATITLCGEWAGPGIQKSVAVAQIPQKTFFIFGIMEHIEGGSNKFFVYNDDMLINSAGALPNSPQIFLLPTFGRFSVDFRFRENVQRFIDDLNNVVALIEEEDPYIKEVFDISGVGEGLVFYPHTTEGGGYYCTKDDFDKFGFKVKGEKHAVNKAGKPARMKSDIPESAFQFVEQHVTQARLEQGLGEVGEAKKENIGKFIGWVCKDVAVESAQEIEESGLEWKGCLSGLVAATAREWFIKKCEEI